MTNKPSRLRYEEVTTPKGIVMIPSSAAAWELYEDSQGCGLAAYRLTKALKKALESSSAKKAWALMQVSLEKHAKYGATDTEPRAIVAEILRKAFDEDFNY